MKSNEKGYTAEKSNEFKEEPKLAVARQSSNEEDDLVSSSSYEKSEANQQSEESEKERKARALVFGIGAESDNSGSFVS